MSTRVRDSHGVGSRRRLSTQAPQTPTTSIAMPMPTMTRKAQNTGATGGCIPSNSFRPLSSPSTSCVRMIDASFGISTAMCVVRASSSGRPNSTSGTPRSVSQIASMAAIFAGWCFSVFRPCRSPSTICTGMSSAPM